MSYAFWKERKHVFPQLQDPEQSRPRAPIPKLGTAEYEMSMVGTIGELIEKYNLREKKVAVWGGNQANAYSLPFRYRISADWFMLPEKPIPVLSNSSQVAEYDYIISPGEAESDLEGKHHKAVLVSDENRVWLYQLSSK